MNVIVQRFQPTLTGLSWRGELLIDDKHFCYTVERGPKVPEHPPIPFGTYHVKKTMSPHLSYVCPELLDVPGRSHIRIHVANYWHELLGCTAVGFVEGVETGTGESSVFESRSAFDQLMALLPEEFVITYRQSQGR